MKLVEQLREAIRVRHYSLRTEQAYVDWLVRYCRFHHMKHPQDMGDAEVSAFLTALAADQDVAASTHNQALNALVFLYKHAVRRARDSERVTCRARPAGCRRRAWRRRARQVWR